MESATLLPFQGECWGDDIHGTQGVAIGLKATLAFQAALTNRRKTYERRMGI